MGFSRSETEGSERAWLYPESSAAGAQGVEDWLKAMEGWTPLDRGQGIQISPEILRDAEYAKEVMASGGWSPEQLEARKAMMPYLTGEESFYDVPGMQEATEDYMTQMGITSQADIEAELDRLAYDAAAKGKAGSGGHLEGIYDVVEEAGRAETSRMGKLQSEALGAQREAGVAEEGTMLSLAQQASDMYGGKGTMRNLADWLGIATQERQYGLSDIERQYGQWSTNMGDIMRMLGIGTGYVTGAGGAPPVTATAGATSGFTFDPKMIGEIYNTVHGLMQPSGPNYSLPDWSGGPVAGYSGSGSRSK